MKLVVFGLTITSAWGNNHATQWRGLSRALARRRHKVVFFELDAPFYAQHRDQDKVPGADVRLYRSWDEVLPAARSELRDADVGLVTSFCPDAAEATELVAGSRLWRRVFYDLDTPVTLDRLGRGLAVPYIGPRGLADFDLVLSCAGGAALGALETRLAARRAVPLYASVDAESFGSAAAVPRYASDLCYLGMPLEDRREVTEALFLSAAQRDASRHYTFNGAEPREGTVPENVLVVRHLPPAQHASFLCSARLCLVALRGTPGDLGCCPAPRLFQAAACGVPLLSEAWQGLGTFFAAGREILVTHDAEETLAALRLPTSALARLARAARSRTLEEHTADRRVRDLERALEVGTAEAALASAAAVGA